MANDTIVAIPLTLLEVETRPNLRLEVTLKYTDTAKNTTILLESGIRYNIVYLKNGELHRIIGRVIGCSRIYKPLNAAYPQEPIEYMIRIDASSDYASLVVDMKTSQIRSIKKYIQYEEEDNTTLKSTSTNGGIISGDITSATIKNATWDEASGKISGGDITDGKGGSQDGGTTDGKNNDGHQVYYDNTHVIDYTITAGKIIAGTVQDVTYPDPNDKTTIQCKTIAGAIINGNPSTTGGTATGGYIINAVIVGSVVTGGTRTGSDMITTGATVVDLIGTGGITTGGTLHGGTATGTIDGKTFTIIDGDTTGGSTTGGSVIGGDVTGTGTVVITGAKIVGGSATGITTGGTTTIGTGKIIPAYISNPIASDVTHIDSKTDPEWDGLIIFDNSRTGSIGSNIATVNL